MVRPVKKCASGILILLMAGVLTSCTSRQVEDTALVSSVAVAGPVILTGYGASYSGKAAYQNTSITLGAPDSLYATEMQGIPAGNMHYSISDSYLYMGSKAAHHFIMHYPVFGLRNILKIPKGKLNIEDEFELTARSSKWTALPPQENATWMILNACDIEIVPGLLQQPAGQFNEDQLYHWTNGEWLNVNYEVPGIQLINVTNEYNGRVQ